ncbi:Structural maintenance of chromosomes protein 4 [Dispira parvispora]|uniref:Structural maintenance of chromosomes protein n=1 Tax=Dispira parvispora TaxID=1520584 RepID=A0A9W8EA53_9FUNG|nr:Structural maintenance of chromosomes protein 4 [Dispira parvispora]
MLQSQPMADEPVAHGTPTMSAIVPSQETTRPVTPPAPETRLIITRMVLNNFKSYAGQQIVGPFHKSFSAVVGPNGSGKSNVIDALLFVFGYRANKMRQGRLSELIHSSQNHQNLASCSVEVHFCEIRDLPGTEAYETIPGSELVISRTALRNNSSKYYMNGHVSSFTQVTTLLREKGVDLDHKRFLILQGEVESISQMKPKAQNEHEEGLLEYLEDIIGTSKYKEPINESGMALDSFTDEQTEKLGRMKIAERERNSLLGKKQEAEEYLAAENRLTLQKSLLFQRRLLDASNLATQAEEKYSSLKSTLESELEKFSAHKQEIRAMEDQYKLVVKEYETIGKRASEATKELSRFEREDVQLQENRKFIKTKLKKLDKTLQKDRLTLSELESTLTHSDADKERAQQDIGQLERQLEGEEKELSNVVESLKDKTEVFSQQIEQHQNELAPWVEKTNAEQSRLDIAQAEYRLLEEKSQATAKQLEQVQNEVVELENLKELKQGQLKTQKTQLKQATKKLKELNAALALSDEQATGFREDLTKARQKFEEANANLETFQSHNKVLQALLRMKETGRIEGINHRLGNLGVIDDQYDVAISTACPSLDNLVVDDVASAQKCIEYLRKNNLGRAVFIVLNQLSTKPTPPPETPEGVPRLFDLVKPQHPKYRAAFHHVLRDTLVAKDLDQANRIAFGKKSQRWRVVTLQGQLIEASGAMSGGGNRVARGLMSSTFVDHDVTPEIVQGLLKQYQHAEKQWADFNRLREDMQVEAQMVEKNLPSLETAESKLQMEIEALTQQQDTLRQRIGVLQESDQPDEQDVERMAKLRQVIEGHQGQLATLQKKQHAIEDSIKQLQDKILEVGGVQLRLQKAKVESLKQRIETLQDQLIKSDVALKKAAKDHDKLQVTLERHGQEQQSLNEQLAKVNDEIGAKTLAAVHVKEQCDKVQGQLEDKKDAVEQLKTDLDQKMDEYNATRAREVDLKHAVDEAERQHAETIKSCNYWKGELSRLSLQTVDEVDEEHSSDELEIYPEETLREVDVMEASTVIKQLEAQLARAKPNLSVLTEFRERDRECQARIEEMNNVTIQREQAKQQYDELRRKRLEEFMEGFNIISYKLKEMYQMITLGGNAELELVDSLDPFSEGIIFSVMPPKKSWRNIANLSGGEKTLSSLALVFALHHYKPTPLYVMDEIDAALDFRNVSIVANYIKDRTKNAQFIIISLRNNMFELADRLVGIYKTHNQTKSIAINPGAAAQRSGTITTGNSSQAP